MSWTVLRLARLTNLHQLELRCRMSSWYGETAVLQSCQFSAWFRSPSVESPHFPASCYLHDWRYFCMLFVYASVAYCWRVPLHDLRRLYGSFTLACESSYAPLPSAPPTRGVPGTMTTTTFLLTENRWWWSRPWRPSVQACTSWSERTLREAHW